MSTVRDRVWKRWALASSLLAAALVLFALLNAAAAVWLRTRPSGNALARRFDLERIAKAYPGLGREEVAALLRETERLDVQVYEPMTESRPREQSGRYVNVSPIGYRLVADQSPWPPDPEDVVVFFFGGSNANGYGLPDAASIPSLVQASLRRAWPSRKTSVYNFARPGYFSSVERVLFEQLVVSGTKPSIAVFVDGLNEFLFRDDPARGLPWRTGHSEALRRLQVESAEHRSAHLALAFLRELPLTRALGAWRRPPRDERETGPLGPEAAQAVARRTLANRDLIRGAARGIGVQALFVWQPISTYRYDAKNHLFNGPELESLARRTAGYELLDPDRHPELGGPDVLGLAGIQEGRAESLYVDWIHYDAALSKEIAARIVERLTASGPPLGVRSSFYTMFPTSRRQPLATHSVK